MIELSRTCCLSGHRTIPVNRYDTVMQCLHETVTDLVEQGYDTFLTGGALGFDTLGAQVLLSLKEQYPQLRLILVQPCATQTAGWSRANVEAYESIRARCIYLLRNFLYF